MLAFTKYDKEAMKTAEAKTITVIRFARPLTELSRITGISMIETVLQAIKPRHTDWRTTPENTRTWQSREVWKYRLFTLVNHRIHGITHALRVELQHGMILTLRNEAHNQVLNLTRSVSSDDSSSSGSQLRTIRSRSLARNSVSARAIAPVPATQF